MPSPSWEDLDCFLEPDNSGGFAASAVISFQGGGSRTVNVIFDDPYFNAELGEYDHDTSDPRALGRMSDYAGVHRGDTLTIDGQVYDILTDPRSDGTGMATLSLAKPVS